MNKNVREEKLKMWKKQLEQLEKELKEIYARKAEAAQEGDLRENAAYQMAVEDAQTWTVRINEIKKIIAELAREK